MTITDQAKMKPTDIMDALRDPRSAIPNDIAIMALQVLDWQMAMNDPAVVETLRDYAPKLDALATDIFSLIQEVTND